MAEAVSSVPSTKIQIARLGASSSPQSSSASRLRDEEPRRRD